MKQVQVSAPVLDSRPEEIKEELRNGITRPQTALSFPSQEDTSPFNTNSFPIYIEYDLEHEFNIEKSIKSVSSHIIVIRYEYTDELLYLKMWNKLNGDRVYNTGEVTQRRNYLVNGLAFNRCFAPGVHLGIIPIRRLDKNTVTLGRLIEKPIESQLEPNVEYAAVMRYLCEQWQLSVQLEQGTLSNESALTFLAQEVARIHKQLKTSSHPEMGSEDWLYKKLQFNIDQLKEILEQRPLLDEEDQDIIATMVRTHKLYRLEGHFKRRREKGHIKHCHGDLKATNLWIYPGCKEKEYRRQLLALDCIDFDHPEFYHIDTLSDVAMLAVDIEMYMTYHLGKERGEHLVKRFLNSYLDAMDEECEEIEPLLEYYMTEKAIVCASTTFFYDPAPSTNEVDTKRIEKYLQVAIAHTCKLKNLLQ